MPQATDYRIPPGLYAIPLENLDLRPDSEIDNAILQPKPITGEKNIWFFWHSGYGTMHPYTQRNIRAWHRRLSPAGWTVRVVDSLPGSPMNVSNFLDVHDPATFPAAFRDGKIKGDHAVQHTSDLVRFPLLLKYGGVYADVGMLQIGDLDRLWNQTIGDPDSPFEVLSYNFGSAENLGLTNYFLCSGRENRLFRQCHRLLLALWAEDGGKTSTEGMHASGLIKGVPFLDGPEFEEDGKKFTVEESSKLLTDYIIQSQAISMAMSTVDDEDDWDGPRYCREHVYAIEFLVGAQLINEFTDWDGKRAWELMRLKIPEPGDVESEDQKLAREIVEACLTKSFGFKLATGLILRMVGPTLSSLWRANEGSDDVEGTYAHWLRHAMVYWNQSELPPNVPFTRVEPLKRGPLLRAV